MLSQALSLGIVREIGVRSLTAKCQKADHYWSAFLFFHQQKYDESASYWA